MSWSGTTPVLTRTKEFPVIALGLVLLIIGAVVSSLHVLFTIGIILLLVGLFLNFVPMGGSRRRVW
jgi:hypothetical protein